MDLPTLWFILLAVLWIGYLGLEGFDFGVGMFLRGFVRGGADQQEAERRVLINTIGPVWDGNEVWVITAVGATFAAFPEWYATALSAYYVPLVVILIALIGRGVAFEYRGKSDSTTWKRRWDLVIFAGSVVPAFLWGVLLAGFVHGLPLNANHDMTGGMLAIFTPFTALGGVVTVVLSVLHGAHYLALKTRGDIRHRARKLAIRLAMPTVVIVAGFLWWVITHGMPRRLDAELPGGSMLWLAVVAALVAVASIVVALVVGRNGREGWAFIASFVTIAMVGATMFASLYPAVLPSTGDPAHALTITNASSSETALTLMTWVAAVSVPIILTYQGWVYWTFRRRIGVGDIP